jgi:hypothetical protein
MFAQTKRSKEPVSLKAKNEAKAALALLPILFFLALE